MPGGTGRFRRADRILRSSGFRRVLGRGERSASRNFVVFVAVNSQHSDRGSSGRIGITVSKRVGNSVVRNHVKRRIREWYRTARERLPSGTEIVVIARNPASGLATQLFFADLDRAIQKYQTEMGRVN